MSAERLLEGENGDQLEQSPEIVDENLKEEEHGANTNSKKVKPGMSKNFLIAICCGAFVADMAFGVLAPFFPRTARKEGIAAIWTGVVFSIQPFVGILVSFHVPQINSDYGIRTSLIIALSLLSVSHLIFALAHYLDPTPFIILCIFARCMQGVTTALFDETCGSLIITLVPEDELSTTLGIFEGCRGIGLVSAPIVGAVLYEHTGFSGVFYANSIIAGIVTIYVASALPEGVTINHKEDTWAAIGEIFSFPEIVLALTTSAMAVFGTTLILPGFTLYAEDNYHMSVASVGVLLGCSSIAYAVFAPAQGAFADVVGNFNVIVVNSLFIGISLTVLGRTPPLDNIFPKESWVLYLGMSTVCIAFAGIIPIIAYINEKLLARGFDTEEYSGVINICFNNSMRVGEVFGPLLASILMTFTTFSYISGGGGCAIIIWTIFWYITASAIHEDLKKGGEEKPLLDDKV